ncbi:helical backbone metal receptor [Fluviispira multicolorata]|uniref:ABC transporter substrate-binding protein n=1 Tax=Fluviispira multicolorata TaxID=2654512 RepID=A0A833JCV7_9BACT|nr:helical backbone metal receptor [Fluviispira multicolorata]KAB8030946.1 ABC transporter substrate-binding protein [Fluviispira multicolorata]
MRIKLFLLILFSFIFNQFSYAINKQKIVTLAPNLTEIVFALELEDQLVGNTFLCDFPKQAQSVYKVGQYNDPSLERILISGANVVLATEGNPVSKLNKLKSYGIKIIEVNPKIADDLPKIINNIAESLGAKKKGIELSRDIQKAINSLELRVKNKKSFLFVLQFNPIYSVSEETWLGDLFLKSGLKNIVGKSVIKYPIISTEFLLKNKPNIILVGAIKGKNEKESLAIQRENIKKIFGKDSEKIEVVLVPKDVLVRPGPRITEGIKFIEGL